jgi:hypothetical protein
MQVNIYLNLNNAAFGETADEREEELSRVLTGLANRFRLEGIDDMRVMDANGNTVGRVTVS